MNCFYHPATVAVGMCKHCSRGLCPECAADEGYGLACKNRCEPEVSSVSRLIEKNKSASARAGVIYFRTALIYGLMGLFFLGFAFAVQTMPSEVRYLFIGIGGIFLLGAILNALSAGRNSPKPNEKP